MTPDNLDHEIAFNDAYQAWLKVAEARDAEWIATEIAVLQEFQQQIENAEFLEGPLNSLTYEEYLRTETWRLRASQCKRWGYCHDCGGYTSRLHAHHLTYARIRYERPSDLIPLCRFCHANRHHLR